ncbi:kelch repeat-containing protein [Geomesophilobacter sediminis]|uniref:Carboxypeptidase regulatory-like domain-containing protein n=1 Tax=Geomesophilobacter sediminis TaxID=2798584 RepID=A0A8J7JFZ6_9BACT|nr:kelch repeat-containing protein [Geomesophilobacter sediminis]MBJ6723240.1 carboxypeptidase regulatory-like domain-containing protein [Geomesophilobacter sediminis]
MKTTLQISRLVFVLLGFAVLLLAGCGGSDSTPTGTFTAGQVSGKTFAYASAGSTGTLAFNADGTWSTTIASSTFSGTWSVSDGKLVCVTTAGGDHTVTYTLLSTTSNSINTSFVEVNPAAPDNPANGTATLTATFTTGQVSGKTFAYSSAGSTGTLAVNADGTWSTTIGSSTFSGTWSITNGKLVCVTTAGGNHTLTYTALVSDDAKAIHTSVVEVNPSDSANPATNTATFTALYTISGKISQSDTGLAGVTVALEGDQTLTATTDADGTYRFTVPAGEYRVTPSNGNSAFAPLDNSFAVSGADVKTVDFVSAPTMAGPNINKWVRTGSLIYDRCDHTATLLQNGKVLVAGGLSGSGSTRASAEIYDPATGKWTQTGSLNYKRYGHTATLLRDGRVLVAGGWYWTWIGSLATRASAEIYDPATGTWTQTGSLKYDRYEHTATLLQDGRVLVAGGTDTLSTSATAEIYDPATGTWTQTGSLNYKRYYHTATLLHDGRVLVAGGQTGDQSTWSAVLDVRASAEIYDPATGKWTQTGSLNYDRSEYTATLLQDGKVLVAGGDGDNGWAVRASAEIYDPATGKWTQTGSLNNQCLGHTATLLLNGKVLVSGAADADTDGSAEIYDPATGTWTLTGSLNDRRTKHTATLLDNGAVLITGGIFGGNLASSELFFPGP